MKDPKADDLDEQLQIRLRTQTKDKLLEFAEEDGRKLSDYVRRLLEEHVKGVGRRKERVTRS